MDWIFEAGREIPANWRNVHPRHGERIFCISLFAIPYCIHSNCSFFHLNRHRNCARRIGYSLARCSFIVWWAAASYFRKKFSHIQHSRSHHRMCLHMLKYQWKIYKKKIVDNWCALGSDASHSSFVISCVGLSSPFSVCRTNATMVRLHCVRSANTAQWPTDFADLTDLTWLAEPKAPDFIWTQQIGVNRNCYDKWNGRLRRSFYFGSLNCFMGDARTHRQPREIAKHFFLLLLDSMNAHLSERTK